MQHQSQRLVERRERENSGQKEYLNFSASPTGALTGFKDLCRNENHSETTVWVISQATLCSLRAIRHQIWTNKKGENSS